MLHRVATYAYCLLTLVLVTVHTLPSTPSPQYGVDTIESLECTAHNTLIVTTTKRGPVEQLKVNFELANLSENKLMPSTEFTGLLALMIRGRYEIHGYLAMDGWYGLSYRIQSVVGGQTMTHTEDKIFKVGHRGECTDVHELYDVEMHRSFDGQDNLEGLYVTAKWLSAERISRSELLVKTKVYCNSSVTTKDILLQYDEDAITLGIKIDYKYEFESLNTTANQVQVHITPLKCHKVCWQPSVSVPNTQRRFTSEDEEECEDIRGTSGITSLRNFKRFMVEENDSSEYEVLVETELGEEGEEGFVTLSALRLGDNDSDIAYKTFSTIDSHDRFSLPLSDDGVFAVKYEYTKVKPIHYSAKKHFVVESPATNSSHSSQPLVNIIIEPKAFKPASSVKIREHPVVTLTRGEKYRNYEMLVHIEPFCEVNRSSNVILNDKHPNHNINVSHLLCSIESIMYFCDQAMNYTECSPILCYSTSVRVETEDYPSDIRCLNVTSYLPIPETASSISIVSTLSSLIVALIIYLSIANTLVIVI